MEQKYDQEHSDQSMQLKVARCCHWNLDAFFKICFCFVLLYNKSLNDWHHEKQGISMSDIPKKQNSVFPLGSVMKC